MGLPDCARLLDYSEEAYRALARRLREMGVTLARVAPVVSKVAGLHPMLRAPMRSYHLQRQREPAAYAMRALLFQDPITEEEARAAFGSELEALLAIGLLARREDGAVVAPFVMSLFNELFLLSDDLTFGGEGVMGFGESTIELCRAVFPEKRRSIALDLGCGAGTAGLLLAAATDKVIATDINPRAMTFCEVNARLNGIRNIEFRLGSSFEPVAGETFDIIASQPPFVPVAEGDSAAAFLGGGRRGDEITLAMLKATAAHLRRNGRAVFRADLPDDGAPLGPRLREAAGPKVDLLVLSAPRVSDLEHASAYAAGLFPRLGAALEAEVGRRLAHLAAAGIQGFVPAFVVVERGSGGAPRTDIVDVVPLAQARLTSGRIDKMLAARQLKGQRGKLLGATLRVPEGTVLAQEQSEPGAEVESKLIARLGPGAALPPVEITPDQLFLATFAHESRDVRAAVARFAEESGMETRAAEEHAIGPMEDALANGLLEVAS